MCFPTCQQRPTLMTHQTAMVVPVSPPCLWMPRLLPAVRRLGNAGVLALALFPRPHRVAQTQELICLGVTASLVTYQLCDLGHLCHGNGNSTPHSRLLWGSSELINGKCSAQRDKPCQVFAHVSILLILLFIEFIHLPFFNELFGIRLPWASYFQ